tara:strand:- start:4998 stop:5369 length:372 start_codon:yes stop_codon:yes gene_type:complete
MKQHETKWQLYIMYSLIIVFILTANIVLGQNICKTDICVVEFNAGWNSSNSVSWLKKLDDCSVKKINIDKGDWAKKYNIVVVPTIIVFNGKEVERFQADISFAMRANLEDVQDVIDEILMEDF